MFIVYTSLFCETIPKFNDFFDIVAAIKYHNSMFILCVAAIFRLTQTV